MPGSCQCVTHPHSCQDAAAPQNHLCEHCREGCVLVGGGSYWVHIHLDGGLEVEPRMQRVRENCTGEVMAYAPAYWDEPADECDGTP